MEQSWELLGPDNEVLNISHTPRVASNHFDTIKQAAIQHQGIALLPSLVCMGELQRQELVQLFPDWRGPENIIHAIYPSRHGQSAAVREFIVFLKSVFMNKV
ncbi:MAG: LysR substrate-binding domain-containing protein [Plesiomonas shigelloides]